jgi:hypothetical protein
VAWHVDYIPADFTAVALGVREAETCQEAEKMIAHGREILQQLRRRKVRLPNPAIVERWKRSVRSFKKHCKRGKR